MNATNEFDKIDAQSELAPLIKVSPEEQEALQRVLDVEREQDATNNDELVFSPENE
jgi:hypothetical protein